MSTQETEMKAAAPAATDNPSPTPGEKFAKRIEKMFNAEVGGRIKIDEKHRVYAQHLFVAIDTGLREAESRRLAETSPLPTPVTWANIDMVKLASRALYVVMLELDAFTKNHVWVIPYWNNRTRKYDVDLRVGYMGMDHVAKRFSVDNVVAIRYSLVHKDDEFDVVTDRDGVEKPVHNPANRFEPGEIVGGYGHVICDDPRKNRVIVVTKRQIEKSQAASQGTRFWGGVQTEWKGGKKVEVGEDERFYVEMVYKTVVHRVCSAIAIDPIMVNQAEYQQMLTGSADAIEATFREDYDENANAHGALSLPSGDQDDDQGGDEGEDAADEATEPAGDNPGSGADPGF